VKIQLIFLLSAVCALSNASAKEVTLTDSVKKYKFLAKTARQHKDYQEAAEFYRKVTLFDTTDQKSWFFLGDVLYRLRDLAQAKAAFFSALKLDSLHVNTNIRLFSIYSQESDLESAAAALERVLIVKPKKKEYRRKLADLYRVQGDSQRSIIHYEILLGTDQSDKSLVEILAILNQDLGKIDEALKWRRALLSGGDVGSQIEHLEGVTALHLELKNYVEVFGSLYRLALLDTSNGYSYYKRAAELAEKIEDEVNLVKSREGMVRTNARDADTIVKLAEWYTRRGQPKMSEKWVDRGLKADPNAAQLLVLKGDLLFQAQKNRAAIASYERAMGEPDWERIAQQRIWNINPPETEEEKLKRAFFGGSD
jgi:tetratricopeptide (TPR) repeat protein